jgi:hypothetical protein
VVLVCTPNLIGSHFGSERNSDGHYELWTKYTVICVQVGIEATQIYTGIPVIITGTAILLCRTQQEIGNASKLLEDIKEENYVFYHYN